MLGWRGFGNYTVQGCLKMELDENYFAVQWLIILIIGRYAISTKSLR